MYIILTYLLEDGFLFRMKVITINYTALVLWCFLNTLELLPKDICQRILPDIKSINHRFVRAASFITSSICENGQLKWDENDTTTAIHNMWTYAISYNVLMRIGGDDNYAAAGRLKDYMTDKITPCGLLPMRDEGEDITHCLFMQADVGLFLHLL